MMVKLKEITLKHSDEISNLLGIVEISSKFAPSPINTICELFFGPIRNYLGELEGQRINKATERILLGLDKDIGNGKKFNPEIVNLEQVDHKQPVTQELFEQVLRKCKDEPEEKKQVFISNIYRNILTTNSNDPFDINWGHKAAYITEKLTYQELVLFRFINILQSHVLSITYNKPFPNIPFLKCEDYVSLFKRPFGGTNESNWGTTKDIQIIDSYDNLTDLRLISVSEKMIELHRKIGLEPSYHGRFICHTQLSWFGILIQELLFHEEDYTAIPSLKQDIEKLESIIIDAQKAKELEQKYKGEIL